MTKPKVVSSTARASANKRTTLTAKEALFVAQYLVDLNATQAAIRAGYNPRNAKKLAHEAMKRPVVKRAVAKAMEDQQARTLITADETMLGIQRIALKAEKAREFAAALRGHELIGKRYKLFTDRVEVIDTTPRADRLRAARERIKQGGG